MLALEQFGTVPIRHPANSQAVGSAVRDFLTPAARVQAARAAASAMYGSHLKTVGKQIFIDKTPRYHLILDFLIDTFPDAKFIVLFRDPFDIAASYRSTWQVDLPALLRAETDDPLAFDLTVGLDRLHRFAETNANRVHTVRYEDLVSNPAGEMARILAYLDLPATADAVDGLTRIAPDPSRAGRMGDPKILSTRSPHSQSVGGWKRAFDASDRQILLDAIGVERLRALGYGGTADALLADGTLDRGEDLARHHLRRMETHMAKRYADMERIATLGVDLPSAVQRRVQAALAGDGAWERETAAELGALLRAASPPAPPSASLEDQLSPLLARLDAALADIDRLRADVRERDLRIETLLASSSWRLTAPLRRLVQRVRSSP